MADGPEQRLRSVFANDQALSDRVLHAARQDRDQWQLLLDIALYIQTHTPSETDASKKRKLDDGVNGHSNAAGSGKVESSESKDHKVSGSQVNSSSLQGEKTLSADLSFSIPVRKKLSLSLYAGKSGGLDIGLPDGETNIPWSSIKSAFVLPVPEKAVRASYFVLLLDEHQGTEQVVWTCNDRVQGKESDADTERWVEEMGQEVEVMRPSKEEFSSAVGQAHRKGEVGLFVKGHVGSKEGYLFFFPNGILFGFKKPILFYPFDAITSISYTSVLQRTFNLVISTLDTTTIEFSMIDQVDFAGIDEYVKRHGLNDASMAAERQAKKYNVNKQAEDSGTEIAKAEAQMQDQEDEEDEDEEEDYDPGSEGESEGEGESSEDDAAQPEG